MYILDKVGGFWDGFFFFESDNFWNWVLDKKVIDFENNGWYWNIYYVYNYSD